MPLRPRRSRMEITLPNSLNVPTRVLPPEGLTTLTTFRGHW